jgi:hypothetical protein
MVKYLKTKKGYFHKVFKNRMKKRITKKNIIKKNIIKKNKTIKMKRGNMVGGTLSELDYLNPHQKTIILVGELHTQKLDRLEYNNIIRKQTEIIDKAKDTFGAYKTYFYSEAPKEFERIVLTTDDIHSSVVLQYARTVVPTKLSSITSCHRGAGSCDREYADDILSIFDNPEINCVIVSIGLLHVPRLYEFIRQMQPDIKIVVVNTVSRSQFMPLIPDMLAHGYRDVVELVTRTEQPYELASQFPNRFTGNSSLGRSSHTNTSGSPTGTFVTEVLQNRNGEKVYKCPICNTVSGTAAPNNPRDTSLFTHRFDCPNNGKIPTEN